ncbi:MAG: pilus assembly protein PilM [bacterium]|nr:pilus assembly protein PilM [bacterium]
MSDSYFCLNISDNFIKLVDAKKNGEQLDISQIAYSIGVPLFYSTESEKTNTDQSQIIKKLIELQKITKKNVNVLIPDNVTYSQILEMPRLNEKELISAIKYQADQFIPMPIEETNIDIEILFENEITKTILVLMVAAPKNIINRIQNTVELSGLIPNYIENELSAVSRLFIEFSKKIQSNQNNFLIINTGFDSSSIYYYDKTKGLIINNHTFPIGINLFTKEIQINSNIDQSKSYDVLATYSPQQQSSISVETIIAPLIKEYNNEIRKFNNLISEKTGNTINQIYFINDISRFPSLPQFVQKDLQITSGIFDFKPFIKSSTILDKYINNMPFFISTIGGNLR